MDNQLSDQQKQFQDDQLKRADAFEQMVMSKGWEYVKAYFANKLQAFTNGMFTTDEDIEKFERERYKIAGLRELIGFIDSNLEALKRYRDGTDKPKDM